jgi:acetyl esterase
MGVAGARAYEASFRDRFGTGPSLHREFDVALNVDGGIVMLRCLLPSSAPCGAVLYFHGGGWVVGDTEDCVALGRLLADRSNASVVLVNYRLAPEFPYPVAVEDAWTATCWVGAHMAELTKGRGDLVVAGDSAGGCLAAVVAQRARRRGTPHIALQVLVYPVTDCDFTTPSYLDEENQLRITTETMRWFWDLYLPREALRAVPDASPLQCRDADGLPPALIVTAEHDVLRDDGARYAELLRDADVPVELHEFAGQMHGFMSLVNILPASESAINLVARRIRSSLTSDMRV